MRVRSRSRLRRVRAAAGGGSRTLLNAATDFTYLGSHVVSLLAGNNAIYAKGLTHYYDGANLTFVSMGHAGNYVPASFRLTGSPTGGGGGATAVQSWTGTDFMNSLTNVVDSSHLGIWWEDPTSTTSDFWTNHTLDYPQGGVLSTHVNAVSIRKLASNGTCNSFRGFFGFEGVGSRAVWGTVRKVWSHFRTAHSTGPYLYGGGGYSSLAEQGLGPSFGPLFLFGPDPRTGYTDNTDFVNTVANVPSTDFKIGADFRSGATGTDWGSDYSGRTKDRVSRPVRAGYKNYADSGDPRDNPGQGTSTVNTNGTAVTRTAGGDASRFQAWWAGYSGTVGGVTESKGAYQVTINAVAYTVASVADTNNMTLTTSAGVQTGVNCLGPDTEPQIGVIDSGGWDYAGAGAPNDPTGYARGSWVDSSYGCLEWPDNDAGTRPKYGIVTVWTFNDGKFWYNSSQLTNQGRCAVLKVYDPAHVGEVLGGSRAAYKLQPTSVLDLTDILLEFGGGGNTEIGGIVGSTVDYSVTPNLMYLLHAVTGEDNGSFVARVHVFEVAGAA